MSVSHNNVDINYLCDASRISLNLKKKKKGGTHYSREIVKKKSWHNIAVMINCYRSLYWLYTSISVEIINIYSCKSSKPGREDMIFNSSFAFQVNAKTQLLSICGQTIAL